MERKFCTQLKKMNFFKFLNEKYQTKTFEEIPAVFMEQEKFKF